MQRRTLLAAAAAVPLPFATNLSRASSATPGDRELLLGQSAVLSGPLAVVVQSVNAGAALVLDGVNAAGGVHGRRIKVISLDDELKPDRTLVNFKKLQDEQGVFAYFSAVGTGNIAAVTPYLQDIGAPLIGGYGVADKVRVAAAGNAYIVRAGYGREVSRIVQHLTSLGITRIAVAHLASPGGEEILANVKVALAERAASGLAGVAAVKLDGSNATEAGKAIASVSPQAVIMFLGGAPSATFIQAVQDGGARPMFYGMSSVPGHTVAKTLGDRLASGLTVAQVVPYPWSESDAVAREFRARASKANIEVNYYSFEGYFNALVLVEALKRSGRALTRQGLHASLRGLRTRFGNMDVDFTTPGASGSQLVELVHVTTAGRYVR